MKQIQSNQIEEKLDKIIQLLHESRTVVNLSDLQRPTTDSQEREFGETMKEMEREATETNQPDSGKDEPIKPAGPLREMPEILDYFYCVDFYKTMGGEIKFNIPRRRWSISSDNLNLFQSGLCFRYSPEGKAGAEHRAALGIQAPIDREELRREIEKWAASEPEDSEADDVLYDYVKSILEGGSHE